MARLRLVQPPSLAQRLENLCLRRQAATVSFGEDAVVAHGFFKSYSKGDLSLILRDLEDSSSIDAGASCTVLFSEHGRPHFFAAPIDGLTRKNPTRPTLSLRKPEEIVAAERRTTFRVPMSSKSVLAAEVFLGDRHWDADPVDISLGGVFLRFSEKDFPLFPPEEEVLVRLRIHDQDARLPGIVQRREGACYGVFFPDALRKLRNGLLEPIDSLRGIVEALEEDWLLHGPL
jgi:hypothetical protein